MINAAATNESGPMNGTVRPKFWEWASKRPRGRLDIDCAANEADSREVQRVKGPSNVEVATDIGEIGKVVNTLQRFVVSDMKVIVDRHQGWK
jgi:hypothetical protein